MTEIFELMVVAAAAVLGVLIGSHLNVVIHRVPRGESTVSPGSACPACGHAVRRYDNVPIVSWLVLRGRCRDCQEPISVRYLIVEVLTGVLFAVVTAWALSDGGPGLWALPAYLYFVGLGVALSCIDLAVQRLPDRLVLPSYAVTFATLALASAGTGDWGALLRAAAGALVLGGGFFVVRVIKPAGMGLGDVKLAFTLGALLAWLGWDALAVGTFAMFLLGGLVGVALMTMRRTRMGVGVPFGPFMVAGTLVGVMAGSEVAGVYLRVSGIA